MKTIALFVQHPICSAQSVNGIIKSLQHKYRFKIFTKHLVEDNFFDDVDLVCFPGGIGDADDFDRILKHNANLVHDFIRRGGKYLGICMGAYWADSEFFNILSNVRVEQYIRRSTSCTKRPHAKAMPITWEDKEERIYFYDGCCFIGDNMDVVARYSNSDPMAIIQGNIGLIGCHPESQKVWYEYHSWMPRHWHNGEHNKLLVRFVDKLMGDV